MVTKRQQSKQFYRELLKRGFIELGDKGLLGEDIWLGSRWVAYRIKDMDTEYLENILAKAKRENQTVLPIQKELERRQPKS